MELDTELSNAFLSVSWHSVVDQRLLFKYHATDTSFSLLATDLQRVYFESLNARQLRRRLSHDTLPEVITQHFKRVHQAQGSVEFGDYHIKLNLMLDNNSSVSWQLDDIGEKSASIILKHVIEPLFGLTTFKRGVYDKKDISSAVERLKTPFDALNQHTNIFQGLHSWSRAVGGFDTEENEEEETTTLEKQTKDIVTSSKIPTSPKIEENRSVVEAREKTFNKVMPGIEDKDVDPPKAKNPPLFTENLNPERILSPSPSANILDKPEPTQITSPPPPRQPKSNLRKRPKSSFDTDSSSEEDAHPSVLSSRPSPSPGPKTKRTKQTQSPCETPNSPPSTIIAKSLPAISHISVVRKQTEEAERKRIVEEKAKAKKEDDDEGEVAEMAENMSVPTTSQASQKNEQVMKKDEEALERRKARMADLKRAQEERKERERLGIKKKRKL